ncbi:MAG: spore germination protein [Clostridia bacterium]|nr:spore germination protein [Clostridia bacterium]
MELCGNYKENIKRMDASLGVGESFDLIKKILFVANTELTFYYLDGFVGPSMNKLLMFLAGLQKIEIPSGLYPESAIAYFAAHYLPFVETAPSGDPASLTRAALSGQAILFGECFGPYGIVIDCRSYPARSVGEPENDRVMIGSRDGFVETLVFNTALIRRRIRDPALRMKHLYIGSSGQTDVSLCYLEGKADDAYVKKLTEKLSSIKTGALTLGHESLAELLIKKRWYNPFPKIRYTERPDVAASQILEGSVVVLCDNSPEAMILPSSIFDFLQETNDFYFPPPTGTYIRAVRYLVFLSTLLLVPLWFLLVKNPEAAPTFLEFALPRSTGRIPIFLQLLLVEFMIDGLRMACMNTPDMLSNSLSVVGGLILGDFAVDVGWLIPEVILYMAFVSTANFSQRSYELGYAFKFMRISLIILIELFNFVGFWIGVAGIAALLFSNRSVGGGRSYLYPLIPYDKKALSSFFVRHRKRE